MGKVHIQRSGRVGRIAGGFVALVSALSTLGLATPNTPAAALTRAPAWVPSVPRGPDVACLHPPEGNGPSDTLRIIDTGNNRMQSFVPGSTTFGTPSGSGGGGNGQFNGAKGIAAGPWGVTYVADTGNNRVQRFDRGLGYIDQFGSAGSGNGQFNGPAAIGVNSNANMFVLDTGNNRVQRFDMNRNYQSQWGSAGGGNGQFNNAQGLAVGYSDGAIYVADTGNNRVQKFNSSGAYQFSIGGLSGPAAVGVNPLNGDVYVADTGNNRIQQYNSGGVFVRTWGSAGGGNGQFNNPRGIAVSAQYGVFVMDSGNNRIQRFNNDGTFVGVWGSGGSGMGQFSGATAIASDLRGVALNECLMRTFTVGGQTRKITVYYTTANGLPSNRLTNTNDGSGNNIYAKRIADWTQTAWLTYVSYGLGEPSQVRVSGLEKESEVWAFDIGRIGLDGWCCGAFHYQINSSMVVGQVNSGDDRYLGEVAIHELFHDTQPGAYWATPGEPGWSTEGGARNMQDKVTTEIDTWPGSSYTGETNYYLTNLFKTDLRTLSYPGGLFWTYVEEQLGGGTPPDPGYGVSAIQQYFSLVGPLHGLDAVDALVRNRSGNTRKLEDFWTDFTISNYAKRLGGAGARYSYVDEAATSYNSVPAPANSLNAVTPAITVTRGISGYAAGYVRVVPDVATCKYVAFDLTSDQRIGFSIVDSRGGNLTLPVDRFWGTRRIIALRVGGAYSGPDGMTAVLTGLANQASVTVGARCISPTIAIVRPTTTQKSLAGPFDNPGTVVAYVSVTAGGYGPVRGLIQSQFTARIGAAGAAVNAAVGLEDLYALVLAAPNQAADGDYNLQVSLDNAVTATNASAVRYTSQINDNMLVIDRSGSMLDFGKIDAAKSAAQLEITEMDKNAWSGLVSFATTATLDFNLQDITTNPLRSTLRSTANGLSAFGATAIVSGVNTALNELTARGDPGHSCGITLLTDGMDNQSSAAQRAALITRLQTYSRPCPVYSIALGPDADATLLQQFKDASGGDVLPTTLTSPPLRAPQSPGMVASGPLNASWQNRLASFFDDIAARQAGRKRIQVVAQSTFGGTSVQDIPIDDSVGEAVIALNGNSALGKESGLFDPNDVRVDISYPDTTIQENSAHIVYHIIKPKPGKWQMRLLGQSAIGYILMTSGQTLIALDVFARPPGFVPGTGHRVSIIGVLHNREKALPGAFVTADVKDSNDHLAHLRLYDDGQHDDGRANDGVYGNWFVQTNSAPCHRTTAGEGDPTPKDPVCENAYSVDAIAELGDVRREASTSFVIQPGEDFDNDGMPDEWEIANGLNPKDNTDMQADPDGDGLNNFEEYFYGTNPHNPDTDGGGEKDGSEVSHGRNPNDPGDDVLRPILHIDPRAFDRYIVLAFGANPSFAGYHIYRRLWPPLASNRAQAPQVDGWVLISDTTSAGGVFTDTTVANGQSYQYRVEPIGVGGTAGAPVDSVPATPARDTEPPNGWLHINGMAPRTGSRHVTLQLGWDTDAVQVRLSNGADLNNAPWQPLSITRTWDLDPGVRPGQTAWVYAQFRDEAGNVSFTNTKAGIVFGTVIYLPLVRHT